MKLVIIFSSIMTKKQLFHPHKLKKPMSSQK